MWSSKLTKAKVLLSTLLFSIAVSVLPAADAQTRPQSLNGLPEETLQRYDEYRLCMERTGQKDHLGSFGPCDEALFQFRVSRAKATGGPVPVREPVNNWKSAKGPTAQYKVRTAGTDFIFYEAPADFTPEMPDTQKFRPPFSIRLEFNEGKIGRLWKIRLSAFGSLGVYGRSRTYYRSAGTPVSQDFTNLGNAGNDTLLECIYDSESTNRLTGIRAYGVEAVAAVTVYRGDSVFYWHKTIPEAAAAENLKFRASETHPAFLVMNAVDECPPVLTAETRQLRAILLSAPPPPINPWSRRSVSQAPENQPEPRPKTMDDCWFVADDEDPECAALRASARDAEARSTVVMQARQEEKLLVNYSEGDYALVKSVPPVYPARALSRGIVGYVDLTFAITTTGTVRDPVVVFSTTSLFDSAAKKALLTYRYKPRVVDGQPVEVTGVKTRITFDVED